MNTDSNLIEAHDLHVKFDDRWILQGVDLTIPERSIITLIGPNGAGKSTLVKAVLGLIKPEQGTIKRRSGLRIGYTPQRLSIPENMPLTVKRFLLLNQDANNDLLQKTCHETGITHLLNNAMQTLSGGEHQRVMLTRALLRQPNLLVLDEPAQGIDINGQAELYKLVTRLRDEHGLGILMVSHDLHLVMAATDNVICLNSHVCCSGHPESVSKHPAYLELFGNNQRPNFALYTHHHDHTHDIHGNVVSCEEDHHHG